MKIICHYWPFVRESVSCWLFTITRGQWFDVLVIHLISPWTNFWRNIWRAGNQTQWRLKNLKEISIISYLGMKSWDVCDRASTTTHVDRVKKSNPWYTKISLCLNVTIWSSQICLSVIFIYFVKISKYLGKNCTYSHFFQSPVTASAYFWSALIKAC